MGEILEGYRLSQLIRQAKKIQINEIFDVTQIEFVFNNVKSTYQMLKSLKKVKVLLYKASLTIQL